MASESLGKKALTIPGLPFSDVPEEGCGEELRCAFSTVDSCVWHCRVWAAGLRLGKEGNPGHRLKVPFTLRCSLLVWTEE